MKRIISQAEIPDELQVNSEWRQAYEICRAFYGDDYSEWREQDEADHPNPAPDVPSEGSGRIARWTNEFLINAKAAVHGPGSRQVHSGNKIRRDQVAVDHGFFETRRTYSDEQELGIANTWHGIQLAPEGLYTDLLFNYRYFRNRLMVHPPIKHKLQEKLAHDIEQYWRRREFIDPLVRARMTQLGMEPVAATTGRRVLVTRSVTNIERKSSDMKPFPVPESTSWPPKLNDIQLWPLLVEHRRKVRAL